MSESKDREIKDLEKEKLRLEIRALSSWRKWVPVLAPVITVVGTGVILWLSNFFEASAIQLQNRKDSLNYAIQQHQSTLDSFKRKNGLMKDSVSLMKDSISSVKASTSLMKDSILFLTNKYDRVSKNYSRSVQELEGLQATIGRTHDTLNAVQSKLLYWDDIHSTDLKGLTQSNGTLKNENLALKEKFKLLEGNFHRADSVLKSWNSKYKIGFPVDSMYYNY